MTEREEAKAKRDFTVNMLPPGAWHGLSGLFTDPEQGELAANG